MPIRCCKRLTKYIQLLLFLILTSWYSFSFANENIIPNFLSADTYVSPEDFFDLNNPLYDTDAKAIQAAIDDAVPTGPDDLKKILVLQPRKKYLVDNPIDGKGVSILGNNARLTKSGSNSFVVLSYNQDQIFFLQDLIIDEEASIKIEACEHVTIKNCKFFNSSTTPLQFVNTIYVTIQQSYFQDIVGAANGIDISATDGANGHFRINKNTFGAIQNNGIYTSGTNRLTVLLITDNTFANIASAAFHLKAGDTFTINNNIVSDCETFVSVESESTPENYTVSGNVVDDVNTFFHYESSFTMNKLQLNGNVYTTGNDFFASTGNSKISKTMISSNVVTELSNAIFSGSGVGISITNNQFSYSGDIDWPVSISDAQRVRVEGNDFTSTNTNNAVISIPPTSIPAYNIVRHNSFNTNFTSEENLINPTMNEDLTNIIQHQ